MNWTPWAADEHERSPVRVNPVLRHGDERAVSLDGEWRFRLDPDDTGVREGWYERPRKLADKIGVPGCWQGQGFGHDGTDEIWDFGIRARVLRATYQGTGWYGRSFRVPAPWKGARIWLNFGGVHPAVDVWVNGARVGSHCGPFVPFAFEITGLVRSGAGNFVAVRVHERNRWMGLSYNWGGKWSGLFRSVELTATGSTWLDQVCVHPDVDAGCLRFRVKPGGAGRKQLTLSVDAQDAGGRTVASGTEEISAAEESGFALDVPSPALWSPDEPNLYRVDVVLMSGGQPLDALTERVGFVKLATAGKHFLINGQPFYIRGTGDFQAHPETGCPDTCRERWRRKLSVLRQYGYNHVRCQSYVPAPEYYDVADEVGLLVQSEMGMLGAWGGQSPWHRYAWPAPTLAYRDALKWQWDKTVMRDVNHPSANIYCMSNELGADTLFPDTAWQCCRDTKAVKPGAFVIWTDGGYNASLPQDFVNAEGSVDHETDLPVIQHEFRWWSAYPDVRIKHKYSGAVRPYAIEIAEEAAACHGLKDQLPRMARASQRLQYVEARTKMESCRRDNPRLAGISHFNAMDIGLSPQGVVDEFYDRKYADAALWRRTNGDTVVLLDRDFDDRVLTGGQALDAAFCVSDFSHPPLKAPRLEWQLLAGNRSLASGTLTFRHKPFRTCPAGKIRALLPSVSDPQALTLRAVLREGKRTFRNEWSFWLLPAETPRSDGVAIYGKPTGNWLGTVRGIPKVGPGRCDRASVVLTGVLDEALGDYARRGGRIILAAGEGLVRPFPPKLGGGGYFFLPPANYPPLEDGHGGAIIRDHPMLGGFPHEGFADLQFYRLIADVPPVDLEPLGLGGLTPVVQPLSTYFTCLPLAYLLEASVGKGAVILCALDLDQKLPEARYLLSAILQYASGPRLRPRRSLSAPAWERLIHAAGGE